MHWSPSVATHVTSLFKGDGWRWHRRFPAAKVAGRSPPELFVRVRDKPRGFSFLYIPCPGFQRIKRTSAARERSTGGGIPGAGAATTRQSPWDEFGHPLFRRGRRDLLVGISRHRAGVRLKPTPGDLWTIIHVEAQLFLVGRPQVCEETTAVHTKQHVESSGRRRSTAAPAQYPPAYTVSLCPPVVLPSYVLVRNAFACSRLLEQIYRSWACLTPSGQT